MSIINNIEDLKVELGVTSVAGIRKAIFNATMCGCTFDDVPDGVEVNGYAEGADAECVPHALSYPFEIAEFYYELSVADNEGVELFNEWNDDDIEMEDNRSRADDMEATRQGGW